MTLSLEERAIVRAGKAITSRENKVRRDKAKADRKAGGKATRGQERDNGFRQYIRRQPCEARHKGGCAGRIEHAHVSYQQHGIQNSFGRGVKNHDRHANPLCTEHHRIQGNVMGEKPFWAWLDKDAYETAAAHYAAYQGVTDLDDRDDGYEGEAVVSPNDRRAA